MIIIIFKYTLLMGALENLTKLVLMNHQVVVVEQLQQVVLDKAHLAEMVQAQELIQHPQ